MKENFYFEVRVYDNISGNVLNVITKKKFRDALVYAYSERTESKTVKLFKITSIPQEGRNNKFNQERIRI